MPMSPVYYLYIDKCIPLLNFEQVYKKNDEHNSFMNDSGGQGAGKGHSSGGKPLHSLTTVRSQGPCPQLLPALPETAGFKCKLLGLWAQIFIHITSDTPPPPVQGPCLSSNRECRPLLENVPVLHVV